MKTKTKFKVGDKVKILPSAKSDGVSYYAYNKIGRIKEIGYGSCSVSMDNEEYSNGSFPWAVSLCNITPVLKKGEQLLLWDDLWE